MAQWAVQHGELHAEALEKLKAPIAAHDLQTTPPIKNKKLLSHSKHENKNKTNTNKN